MARSGGGRTDRSVRDPVSRTKMEPPAHPAPPSPRRPPRRPEGEGSMHTARPARAAVASATLAGLLALTATPAAASVETIVTHDIALDITLGAASRDCGFRVELHSVGKEVSIRQFDADGN